MKRLLILPPIGDDGTAYNVAKQAVKDGLVFGVAVTLLWAEDDSGYLYVETTRAGMMVLLAEAAQRGYRIDEMTKHRGTSTYRSGFRDEPLATAQGMALMAEALIDAGLVTRAQVIAAVESFVRD